MNKTKKILVVSVFSTALLTFAFAAAIMSFYSPQDGLPIGGQWDIKITRADGTSYTESVHNVVTTIGKTQARDYFSAGDTDITKYLAVSNDASPADSWTKLATEKTTANLTRATGTVANVNTTAYQVTYEFMSSADSQTLQCLGIHWIVTSDSDNNLFAAGAFTQTTLNTNDKLQVTYTLNFGS